MFTAWVVLKTGARPRRTHRMYVDGTTVCGLQTHYRIRFVKQWEQRVLPCPKFCHVCFKYKYRMWSQRVVSLTHMAYTDQPGRSTACQCVLGKSHSGPGITLHI